MLEVFVVVMVVLWTLGLVTGHAMGGLIHILLVLPVVAVLLRLVSGSRSLK